MGYNKNLIKIVQKELNEDTGIKLKIDGVVGRKTLRALLYITIIPFDWSAKRQVIGYFQYVCITMGLDAGPIDGYWGPQTDNAYDDYITTKKGILVKPWRKPDEKPKPAKGSIIKPTNKTVWPKQKENELLEFYGDVGENQVSVKVPYTLRLAWNISSRVNKVTCHEKVSEPFLEIMEETKSIYGKDVSKLGLDLFAGCLNVRRIRGGTTWSTHSWGIAFDFDSAHNRLRWKSNKARFAKAEYKEWFEAWEKQGAVSIGKQLDYDWMHTQFARL